MVTLGANTPINIFEIRAIAKIKSFIVRWKEYMVSDPNPRAEDGARCVEMVRSR